MTTLLLGGAAALICLVGLVYYRGQYLVAIAERADAIERGHDLRRSLLVAEAERMNQVSRLEAVLALHRQELRKADEEMINEKDPAVIRRRFAALGGLSSVPAKTNGRNGS